MFVPTWWSIRSFCAAQLTLSVSFFFDVADGNSLDVGNAIARDHRGFHANHPGDCIQAGAVGGPGNRSQSDQPDVWKGREHCRSRQRGQMRHLHIANSIIRMFDLLADHGAELAWGASERRLEPLLRLRAADGDDRSTNSTAEAFRLTVRRSPDGGTLSIRVVVSNPYQDQPDPALVVQPCGCGYCRSWPRPRSRRGNGRRCAASARPGDASTGDCPAAAARGR